MNDDYEHEDEGCPGYITQCGAPLKDGEEFCYDCRMDIQADYDARHPPLMEPPWP